MKFPFISLLLFILFSCSTNRFAVRYDTAPGNLLPAEVVRVLDGDTVVVGTWDEVPGVKPGTHPVRMIFIDTPESSDNPKLERNHLQYFSKGIFIKKEAVIRMGKRSADKLKQVLAQGDRVELEFPSAEKTDKYGRLLALLFLNGTNVNYLMVREGMADSYFLNETKGPRTAYYRKRFFEAAEQAKKEGLGIWKTLK